ncbi:non-ribosomal peptide synthase/polyketide synthase [Ktedonobacter robiniae]|nr:non-ribosomal peptide synthase/polyketide synthase [Ktedonobacter robiniae]
MQQTIEGFRLSPQQARLWTLQQKNSAAYYTYCSILIDGSLRIAALQDALRTVIERHEVYRTSFRRLPGMTMPMQVINEEPLYAWQSFDLSNCSALEQQSMLERLAAMDTSQLVDVEHGPFMSCFLLTLSSRRHMLYLYVNALHADSQSMRLLAHDIATCYQSNQDVDVDDIAQYIQFAEWQHSLLEEQVEAAGAPQETRLDPHDFPMQELPFERTNDQDYFATDTLRFALSPERYGQIRALVAAQQCTPEHFLLACWYILLKRLTGQSRLLLGLSINGRLYKDLADIAGLLAKEMPFTCQLDDRFTFEEALASIKHEHEQLKRQYTYFNPETLPTSGEAEGILYPFYFEFREPAPTYTSPTGEVALTLEHCYSCLEPFKIRLLALEGAHELTLEIHYCRGLFESSAIHMLKERLLTLIEAAATRHDLALEHLQILSATERQQLLVDLNQTAASFEREMYLHRLFEKQVAQTPDAIALEDEHGLLTYRELDARANQLAHHLRTLGAGPETLIGIYVERSLAMVIGVLGSLKVGAAYIPLDPQYPEERLKWIAEDARLSILLTTRSQAFVTEQVVRLDQDWGVIARQPAASPPACQLTSDSLAYIIYTSGSTGRPKGVMISHEGLTHYVQWSSQHYRAGDGFGSAVHSSLAFDLTVTSLFTSLVAGRRIVLLAESQGVEALGQVLRERADFSLLKITPAHLDLLNQYLQPGELATASRALVIGGEALYGESLTPWRVHAPRTRLINEYGPTETVVGCCVFELPDDGPDSGNIPIGRPIPNTQLYVLDSQLQPVPLGMPGELYIGGVGLSRGYLNRPDLTAERFIANPFATQPGTRLYRTGDLVRYISADGNLEYLGRVDRQVKLRGYRIELGEIEEVLLRHPNVRENVVLLREDEPGNPQLVAYIVAKQQQAPRLTDVQVFLREQIPAYMIPSVMVTLHALPLTVNGKPDRAALPAPSPEDIDVTSYTPPRNPVEELMVSIWEEVLKVPSIGIHDHFFRLGGHSLLATQCLVRIRNSFQVDLPLQRFFDAPTIAELADYVQQLLQRDQGAALPPLVPVDRHGNLPLSFAQQRLWFLDQLEPGNTAYLLPAVHRLRGVIDSRVLEQALHALSMRHEILRTTFSLRDMQPCQIVHPISRLALPVIDLQGLSVEERLSVASRLAQQESDQPCDLTRGPLLRTSLVRLAAQDQVVLLTMHHIITDGWSNDIFYRELMALYHSSVTGEAAQLAPLPVQYADFASWQRQWFQQDVIEAQLAYWKRQLADVVPLNLPTDHPRPSIQTYRGAQRALLLPPSLGQQLSALSQREDVTLFMLLLTAFQVLLARYSGQTDICVGTPIANRTRAELEGLIGFFVNTLVLRADLSGDPTFREALHQGREVALGAYSHQDVPFEQLVDVLQPERDLSISPLFQAMFVMQQDMTATQHAPGHEEPREAGVSGALDVEHTTTKFDLSLFVSVRETGLYCGIEYCRDLFEPATIGRMLEHWQILLEGIVAQPEQPILSLPLLTEAEKHQVLVEWNATEAAYPEQASIPHLFEGQVLRTPDAEALVYEGSSLTYRELNRRANLLACELRSRGVKADTLVGVCMERSVEMVVALLGVLKAGGAYVPMDPAYPQERLAYMLEDAAVSVLLTQSALREQLPQQSARVFTLDAGWGADGNGELDNLTPNYRPEHLIYMIYTSGSTGQPKGVMNTHRGVCNRLHWMQQEYQLTAEDRVLQKTPFSFDVSVWEFFWPLISGATLVMARPGGQSDAAYLARLIEEQRISTLHFVPSMLHAFLLEPELEARCQSLKRVICSGEVLTYELQERFFARLKAQLHNLYGPTEAAIDVTYWACQSGSKESVIPIGRPIANTQIYILDEAQQPVPVGVSGELYIGGVGVARGYHQRPELNREKFIPDPSNKNEGGRLFRSGDLARYRPDGVIEFLGRIDHQVKIRGFRIELGEIEAALSQHPNVKEAIVIAREDMPGNKRLVAYLIPEQVGEHIPAVSDSPLLSPQEAGLTLEGLRTFLGQHLPSYMVPSSFLFLSALPLTPNGKVDRKALPAPNSERPELEEQFVAPRNAMEQKLAEIWTEVLGQPRVGIHDNFFALGGDSILSIQIIARAKQVGIHLQPRQLFLHQSIAQLANVAQLREIYEAQQTPVTGDVPLTPIQHWFFSQRLPERQHYNQARVLEIDERVTLGQLQVALSHLLTQHDALRLHFQPEGSAYRQYYAMPEDEIPFVYIDLSALSAAAQPPVMEQLAAQAQASLDLARGPLLRCVFVDCGHDVSGYLLLVIHHLAVDGVSWRILLADLEQALSQAKKREEIRLPEKTSSFQDWARKLHQYAQSPTLANELPYWLDQRRASVVALPTDMPIRENKVTSRRSVHVALQAAETQALLQVLPSYRLQINDILLTALAQAYAAWTGQRVMLLDLEGHGREDLWEDIDLSRTVGWFTTIFPVLLDIEHARTPAIALKTVKEELRQIPQRGLGYGVLRYLHDNPSIRDALASLPQAQISFNYLGQFDSLYAELTQLKRTQASSGPAQGPRNERSHVLEINASIVDGRLHAIWQYSEQIHHVQTIQTVADLFVAALRALIAHCHSLAVGGYTPSDFPLAGLRQEQLDKLVPVLLPPVSEGDAPASPIEDIYPLSPMQAGMLFHSVYAPQQSGTYCGQFGWTIRGAFQPDAWQRAWQRVIERHAILRTAFLWQEVAEPLQVAYQRIALPWHYSDLRSLAPQEHAARIDAIYREDRERGFDLRSAPLLRLILLRLDDDAYHFIFSHHHLLLDGWSQPLLWREVMQLYQSFCQGNAEPALPMPRPYRDYIAWLRQQDVRQAEQFWRTYLADFGTPTRLAVDSVSYADRGMASQHMAVERRQLSPETTLVLQQFAQQHQLTMNTLIQGAWSWLIACYSGERDVVFGTTVAGRPADLADAEGMIGLFINTLPVRARIEHEQGLLAWLTRLQTQQAEARQYEYTPLFEIQRWSEVPVEQALFESLVLFQNYPVEPVTTASSGQRSANKTSIRAEPVIERTNYPLCLSAALAGHVLNLELTYDCERFTLVIIEHLLEHLRLILQKMATREATSLTQLPAILPAERDLILREWSRRPGEPAPALGLHQLFEAQVLRTPDAIALTAENHHLSYAHLDARARHLAGALQEQGVGPEERVLLLQPRSVLMLISMLGVLKAGGTYVPLDAQMPAERLAHIAAECHARGVLLSRSQPPAHTLPTGMPGWEVEALLARPAMPVREPLSAFPAQRLAYIIYTSGSTGRPKGVAVSHGNVVASTWARPAYYHEDVEHFLLLSPLFFDSSVAGLYWTLLQGGRVVLPEGESGRDPRECGAQMEREGITHLLCIPSWYALLLEQGRPQQWRGLRSVIVAGERCGEELVRAHEQQGPQARLHNEYGPTEATVWCSVCTPEPGQQWEQGVPIGRASAHAHLYVLDARMESVPVGVPGELYVGGPAVVRGYEGQPQQTAERFVPDPFNEQAGQRLYRTGDRVCWTRAGQLRFLGRVDQQIKLRGYRIEVEEIEAVLRGHEQVREAVVGVWEGEGHSPRLVGYIVPREQPGAQGQELRAWLGERLPDYLVPAQFVSLEQVPRTGSGKVDRKRLAQMPLVVAAERVGTAQEESPVYALVQGIWQALLGQPVEPRENFFALGGHSLLATQVVARVRQQMGIELALRELFEAPTLAEFVLRVEAGLRGGRQSSAPALLAQRRGARVPLSFAQQRLWFLEQLAPNGVAYLIPSAQRVRGPLQVAAFERSVQEVVWRHESLRTTFQWEGSEPVQEVAERRAVRLPVFDLSGLGEGERAREAQRLGQEEKRQPCDLSGGPLWRVQMVRLGAEEHVLLLTMHHLISDGWSMQVLEREIAQGYRARVEGREVAQAPLPIQYADYALWQRNWLQGEVLEEQLTYWRTQLADAPSLEFPTDYPRPPVKTTNGALESIHLSDALRDSLLAVSKQEGVTLFMLLLAAFQVLLMRYTGQKDISVGTPIANRTREEVEHLIGFFINTLVIRSDLSGDPTFSELVAQVREAALGAYTHQDVPFEQLVEVLRPERDLSRSPLFQTMFTLQEIPEAPAENAATGIHLSRFGSGQSSTKFDLSFSITRHAGGLACTMAYNTDLFARSTMQRLLNHWQTLLEGIVARPGQAISALPLLTAQERQRILYDWNATKSAFASLEHCVHQLFERQAERTPDAPAVVFEDATLTYQSLNQRANQLAHYLRERGITSESRIGLCLERSLDQVIAVLAILKAGGTYVPVDPVQPVERIAYMLQDARAALTLTQTSLEEKLAGSEAICCLDRDYSVIAQQRHENIARAVQPASAAYVLYTSGSTGMPKGVVVEHRQIVNYIAAIEECAQLEPATAYAMVQPLGVDSCLTMLLPSLVSGSVLHIIARERALDAQALAHYFAERPIDYLKIAPSHLSALLTDGPPARLLPTRRLIIGGEASQLEWVHQVRSLLGAGEMFNHYGPTETTVGSLTHYIDIQASSDKTGVTPVGKPLANTQVYILDTQLLPVPIGVVGELYIGGSGVTRGYLNQPALTAERFVPDPFSAQPGARLYKTGDMVRYAPDGNVEFIGRGDEQVKIRGYRVELGEIETALLQHPAIREAVVLAIEHVPGNKQVVAYAVAYEEQRPATQDVLRFLRDRLPEYMLVSAIHWLEALPLTPHGKVNRKALASLEVEAEAEPAVRPLTLQISIEEMLGEIWRQVLGREEIGPHDNFFESGGHSLLATRLISRVRAIVRVEIPLRALFEAPTISGLARRVEQELRGGEALALPPLAPAARNQPLPLSFAQQRLWFLDRLEPGNIAYLMPVAHRLPGELNVSVLDHCLRVLVLRHESLRTTFHESLHASALVRSGQPIQVVHAVAHVSLPVIDLRGLTSQTRDQEVQRLAQQEAVTPCSLERGPLLRTALLRLMDREHILLVTMHHIISDGWSMQVFIQEFTALYQSTLAKAPSPLSPLPVQYADYAFWQRQWLQGEVLEQQLAYWRHQLSGVTPVKLPTDHPYPAKPTHRGASHIFRLSGELTRALTQVSRQEHTTLFMTLLAAFQVLLYRYSGQTNIVVGTDSANRTLLETESLIGFFINVLPLRTSLHGQPTFREVLQRVREVVLGATSHQETPFDLLVEKLVPADRQQRLPLVQVLFVMQNLTQQASQESSAETKAEEQSYQALGDVARAAKFDLALFMQEQDGQLYGTLNYSQDLFEASTIATMMQRWTVLLEQMVREGDLPIERLTFFATSERQKQHEQVRQLRKQLRSHAGERFELPGLDEA